LFLTQSLLMPPLLLLLLLLLLQPEWSEELFYAINYEQPWGAMFYLLSGGRDFCLLMCVVSKLMCCC
jgi:hypothetical protein